MQRKWLWVGIGIALTFLLIMLIVPLGSQIVTLLVYRSMGVGLGTPPTNDLLAQQMQNVLNLIDFLAIIFTAVLTLAGAVGFRRFQDLEDHTAGRMKEMDDKREEIENLQKEMQDKINAVGELRKYVELQEAVTKSVEDTNKALLYLILGNQLVEQKKIAEAIEAYEKVKELRPDDPQVNYILGRTYRGISSYDQAITCLTTSVEMEPSFAQAHLELGVAYRNRADKLYFALDDEMRRDEEYEKAIEQIKLAAKLQPKDEDILGTLGGIYRRANDYKRALMYYKQVREINPDSSYAAGNIAVLAWHQGDRAVSLEAFRHTEELATKRIGSGLSYDPFWDYYDRGMARLVLGNKDAALSDYRTAIDLTRSPEHFKSVVDGLQFFKDVEDKYPLDGLDEALNLVTEASLEAEARMVAKHVG
jgi:tetratricopeptide (TPR) repeat protein